MQHPHMASHLLARTLRLTVELVVAVTCRPVGGEGTGGAPLVLASADGDGGEVPPEAPCAIT